MSNYSNYSIFFKKILSTILVFLACSISAIINANHHSHHSLHPVNGSTSSYHNNNHKQNDLQQLSTLSSQQKNFSFPHNNNLNNNNSLNDCHRCLNGGHRIGSLIIQEQRSDCISGHYFTLLINDRCECEFICARRPGQTCHPSPNHHHHHHHQPQITRTTQSFTSMMVNLHKLSLCDSYLNWFCNEKTKICEGNLSLDIDQISSDSFALHWKIKKQGSSSTTAAATTTASTIITTTTTGFESRNNRRNPNNSNINSEIFISKYVPQPLNLQYEKLEPKIVADFENNRLSTRIDKLEANTTYLIKVVHNGYQELSILTTKAESLPETLPKVLVTYRNATSITIAFDDFKPPGDDSGYAIHYRPTSGFMHQNNQWLIIKSNGTPFFTLTGLKPNTHYMIQVFTWSDLDHRQVLSSEIIETTTSNGCLFQNKSYELDEKILDDCEQTCVCVDGSVNCHKRCIAPYLSIKEAQAKNLKCTFPTNDECCVRCTTTLTPTSSTIINETNFGGKPGICPKVKQENHNGASCNVSECSHDYHCTGINKCCLNHCGLYSCQSPVKNLLTSSSSSSSSDCPIKCDSNAECRFIEEESAYKCICLDDSFSNNDPKKKGCHRQSTNGRKFSCFFENQSFFIGETFEHDCHSCVCTEALEVECKRKCADYETTMKDIPSHCKLVEDVHDPICCKKLICDLDASQTTQTNQTYLQTDGCKHLNKTYKINETFHIGCELKCLCKTTGEVECSPRCFDDNGYDENFCQLKPDPDDPECCKISICDFNSTLDQRKILIEMAESINSASIKFRLLLFSNKIDGNITIFYSKVLPNATNMDNLIWKMEQVTENMITLVTNDTREIVLGNLEPETDYSVYFKNGDEISNTVVVRTFPEGIDHTFKGCFHGSQIIQVGEMFYEGECEYKCVCKEGGIRDCIERCPVFVDPINSDSCHYIQSSEDPCCTIPICDNSLEVDNESNCIFDNGKQFKIGDTWTYGAGCLEKTCTCLYNKNTNSTEVRCKDGCPEIPPEVLKPNPNCPSPKLIRTEDPCACPYVVCANNINPLDLPPSPDNQNSLAKSSKNYCEFKGNKINIGEEFYDSCRAVCICDVDATLDCRPIHCNHNFGPHTTKCLEWEIDPSFVPRPPNCCPEPKCKNDGSCSFAGLRFPNQQMIPQELLPCHKRCVCDNGRVRCRNICPEIPDDPPPGLPCPSTSAFRGHLPGDGCCIHWQCREIYRDKIYGKCTYKDKVYKLGEYWDDNETEIHRRCQCKITNGILHVVCDPGLCQPITERFLEPTSECKTPTVITPKDAIMCPYVICNNTGPRGEEIENIDIVAINATSLRVRFTIPPIYVGLLGHAEVHYVTDLNVPRNKWNIQKFARPKRLFDIPNIEYHLGNLQPDTTYFLQIEIIIETLKSGPISEIYKVYLPPLPVTTSTTPKTTTSTLPPVIMLDMHLTVVSIDSNSVKVSWRPFTLQEKKFIDGVQVRYKKTGKQHEDINNNNNNNDEWKHSQILHRDSTSYILNKLEPGLTYVIDLMFTSIGDINTNIISSKPLLIELPQTPKDDFHFDFHIYPDDVTVDDGRINIELRNLPRPINKYVNVAKIQYQNVKTLETFYDYVNIDESNNQVSFSNLIPNTRYKLWIDLYLTNGHVVSSNTIDLITNFEKQFFKDKNSITNINHWSGTSSRYLFGLTIISTLMFLTGSIFLIITCICLRKQSSKAAISRVCISEAAYDNPTYKTFEKSNNSSSDKSIIVVDDAKISSSNNKMMTTATTTVTSTATTTSPTTTTPTLASPTVKNGTANGITLSK